MSEKTEARLTVLGGTIRLVHDRADGGRTEMSLTRGAGRVTAMYAVTDAGGRLRCMSARSWPVSDPQAGVEPELGRELRCVLEGLAAT